MLEGFFARELNTHQGRPRRWVPRRFRFRHRAADRAQALLICHLYEWLSDSGYDV